MRKSYWGLQLFVFFGCFVLLSCSHQSVLPISEDVKVGREDAAKDCTELGKVTGTTLSAKGTAEEAIEDLKKDAARKGATYVKIGQYSAMGTAVSGIAYQCK